LQFVSHLYKNISQLCAFKIAKMTTGTKTIKQKLFFSAMVLAFMWVITGDLVSIHLEVIFGKQVDSSWHHPLAKTHKDDGATFKVKQHKSDSGNKHLDFTNEAEYLPITLSKENLATSTLLQFTLHQYQQNLFLRGPPSLA